MLLRFVICVNFASISQTDHGKFYKIRGIIHVVKAQFNQTMRAGYLQVWPKPRNSAVLS